jgi:RHS repeat-associated protein
MDYLYNGKELEEEDDWNWYAYGFRYYDPAIGRFSGVDPIAEQFPWVSPYNYAENMVPMAIDLWGLQAYLVTQVYNTDGNIKEMYVASHTSDGKILNNGATDQEVMVFHLDADGNQLMTPTYQDGLDPLQDAVMKNGAISHLPSSGFAGDQFTKFDQDKTTINTSKALVKRAGRMIYGSGDLSSEELMEGVSKVANIGPDEVVFGAEVVFSTKSLQGSKNSEIESRVNTEYSPITGTTSSVNLPELQKAASKEIPNHKKTGEPNAMGSG